MADIRKKVILEVEYVGGGNFKTFLKKEGLLGNKLIKESMLSRGTLKELPLMKIFTKETKKAAKAQERFKMHLLGTLFAGMAMQRWMKEYTDSARDMLGMTKLHSAAMTNLMLPAQQDVANMYRDLDMWLLGLGETERRTIGWLIQGTQWAGKFMSAISQIALGWDSFKKTGLFKWMTETKVGKFITKKFTGGKGLGGIVGWLEDFVASLRVLLN